VDLTERGDLLARLDPANALFLGCRLTREAEERLRQAGALVFPHIPDTPFDAYRGLLYTAEELYAGLDTDGYESTPDARIYAWAQNRRAHADLPSTLAEAVHDHAISDALEEALAEHRVVGVMGGHALRRGDPGFAEAARLGRGLARAGFLVATGGGPGAMEAANLGAYLAPYPDVALEEALALLRVEPDFSPDATRWARAAFAVRRKWPDGGTNIGIPTFHYGHEPPNIFATGIAKYFRNALREDTLLRWCDAGIAFLPGAAGTVQELFQATTENYYADATAVAPLVLIGREHWSKRLPAWQLLSTLAAGRAMEPAIALVDDVHEVVRVLSNNREPG
ncbi:MAG TPA: LOG family protein, partial [Actinopolymorphaceae bacterium]